LTIALIVCGVAAALFNSIYLLGIPLAVCLAGIGWTRFNFVFALLLVALPFSTELQLTPSLGTDFPDELLMLLASGLAICYAAYSPRTFPRRLFGHPIIILLIMSFVWSAVTAAYSTVPVASIKFLLAKTWYVGAFVIGGLIIFKNSQSIWKSWQLLTISMVLVVMVAIIRQSDDGFAFARVNDALRPFFRNHVNYSAMLVCMIPAAYGLYLLTNKKWQRRCYALAIAVLLSGLAFSYSRGAWLALPAGILSWWLTRKNLLLTAYVVLVAVVAAALVWLATNDHYLRYAHNYRRTVFHKNFSEHLAATYQFRDMSTAERFNRWVAGVRMTSERPVAGFGPATFYSNYKPYAVPAFKTWVSDNPEHSTVHNYFLLITVEQGWPGLLLFLTLLFVMLACVQRLYHSIEEPAYRVAALATGSILMMILTVNFLSDLIETDKIGSLFFLCAASLVSIDRYGKKRAAR
jgi:O-antigen ligase